VSYRIEITADTLSELAGKAASLAAKLNSEPSQHEVAEAVPANPAPTPPAPVAEAPVAEASASDVPDFDTVVTPLVLKLVEVKGKPVAQEVLGRFGIIKASQLSSERWHELVDAINDELAV